MESDVSSGNGIKRIFYGYLLIPLIFAIFLGTTIIISKMNEKYQDGFFIYFLPLTITILISGILSIKMKRNLFRWTLLFLWNNLLTIGNRPEGLEEEYGKAVKFVAWSAVIIGCVFSVFLIVGLLILITY